MMNCQSKRGAHRLKYASKRRLTRHMKWMRVITRGGKRTDEKCDLVHDKKRKLSK